MDKKIMTYNFCIHMHFVTPWHVFKNTQYEMDFSGSFFFADFSSHPTMQLPDKKISTFVFIMQ